MRVLVYDDGDVSPERVAEHLRRRGLEVEVRGSFLRRFADESAAERLAGFRMGMPCRDEPRKPLPGEVEYERRLIEGRAKPGVVYHALLFQSYLRSLLPEEEVRLDRVHVVLTSRLIATCDSGVPHLRVVVLGYPGVVSASGAVEAPARSREYHLLRGIAGEAAAELMAGGDVLRHGDERLPAVLASYVMQVVFYQAFGEAFCTSPECMLHDSRWQHEVLRAQLAQRLCPRHERMLGGVRGAVC